MSYIIISVQIRYENGPTRCGDVKSDPELMKAIGAELTEGDIKYWLYFAFLIGLLKELVQLHVLID